MIQKRISVAVVAVCALSLAGCQTTNPYTGQQQTSKSTSYGIGGALAGAAIGALVDGGDGAWKGALIGGAAGMGAGYQVDQQEARLRAELEGTGVQVYRVGDEIKLIMPANITFDSSESDIKAAFYPVLGSVAKVFKEYDLNLIEISGYTDSTGGSKINMPLSQARANSVASYLIYQGVSPTRITAIGRADMNPIASNATADGRAANRRVEIKIRPIPQQP